MKAFKTISLLTLSMFVLAILSSFAIAQEKQTARDIIEKTYDARKLDGSESVQTLTILNDKGQKRIRKMAAVTKLFENGKTEKKMSRFLSPADVKGTVFLTYDYEKKDDDMWMFLPALRKTRRIVSSEKSKSFMGSEFSYSDMNIPILDDYKYTLLKEEKMGGVDCFVIQSLPANEDVADQDGYSKKIAWIGKQDLIIRKSDYYDLDGEYLKTMTASGIKLIDPEKKRYRPMKLEMVNKQNGRKSLMNIEKLVLNREVKDDYFTTRYLERQ